MRVLLNKCSHEGNRFRMSLSIKPKARRAWSLELPISLEMSKILSLLRSILLTHILLWMLWTRMIRCLLGEILPNSKILLAIWFAIDVLSRRIAKLCDVMLSKSLFTTHIFLFIPFIRSIDLFISNDQAYEVMINQWTSLEISVHNMITILNNYDHDKRISEHRKSIWQYNIVMFTSDILVFIGGKQWEIHYI